MSGIVRIQAITAPVGFSPFQADDGTDGAAVDTGHGPLSRDETRLVGEVTAETSTRLAEAVLTLSLPVAAEVPETALSTEEGAPVPDALADAVESVPATVPASQAAQTDNAAPSIGSKAAGAPPASTRFVPLASESDMATDPPSGSSGDAPGKTAPQTAPQAAARRDAVLAIAVSGSGAAASSEAICLHDDAAASVRQTVSPKHTEIGGPANDGDAIDSPDAAQARMAATQDRPMYVRFNRRLEHNGVDLTHWLYLAFLRTARQGVGHMVTSRPVTTGPARLYFKSDRPLTWQPLPEPWRRHAWSFHAAACFPTGDSQIRQSVEPACPPARLKLPYWWLVPSHPLLPTNPKSDLRDPCAVERAAFWVCPDTRASSRIPDRPKAHAWHSARLSWHAQRSVTSALHGPVPRQ